MNMKRNKLTISLSLIAAFAIGFSLFNIMPQKQIITQSGVIAKLSEDEVMLNSELIVEASFIQNHPSKWTNPDGKLKDVDNIIYTDAEFKINDVLSGEYNSKNVLVRLRKGADSNTVFYSDAYPDFEKDQKVILFLMRDDANSKTNGDYFVLTGVSQGAYKYNDKTNQYDNCLLEERKIGDSKELKARIVKLRKENPDWKEKQAIQKEKTRINNEKLFGE